MWFRITNSNVPQANGAEFEVCNGSTEEQVAAAAFECVSEWLDYSWEKIKRKEKHEKLFFRKTSDELSRDCGIRLEDL